MKVALLGYGDQGRSAFDYWHKAGNEITICDMDVSLQAPAGAQTKLGADYLNNLDQYDLLVRTPSLHPRDIVAANPENPHILDKVTTNTNEFFKVCKAPIIGVTGSKGKGTTSSLITNLLEAAGKRVHLGGNIGTPPLDMLKNSIQSVDIVVLELANFQLIDIKYSPHIAVCLMITEEHLNWHAEFYEYVQAKAQMFKYQNHDDIVVFNAENVFSGEIAAKSSASNRLTYDVPGLGGQPQSKSGAYVDGNRIKMNGKTVCSVEDVKLRGRHNLENVCAAIAATWDLINHDTKVIKQVLQKFVGLPHRLEEVRKLNNVTYVDDSFGTMPATAIVAMKAYPEPKIIILGGSDKGANFEELADTVVSENVKCVLVIGQTGPTIAELIADRASQKTINVSVLGTAVTMPEIVKEAHDLAQPGDVVLLSTACASFDMFKDYKDRGEQFKQAVAKL